MSVAGGLERRKAATMQAILDAAERMLQDVGYDKSSMDSIAIVAGVSRKTLFNYVESKAALVKMLIERRLGEPYTTPFLESDELATGMPEDLLPPFHLTLQAFWDSRWLLRLGVEHANLFSSFENDVGFELEPNRVVRVTRVRKLQAARKIRSDIPPERIVHHFEILRNAAFRNWLKREGSTLPELRQEISEVMDLMICGLKP